MTQKSKVAVIGMGTIGTIVATNLVKGNRSVIVADRTFNKAKELSLKLGGLAQAKEISAAIKEADIIIPAIWYSPIKELFNTYSAELQGKIIVDPSNPIAPDEKGGFKKIIDKEQSAGQVHASLLPHGAKLAKAFGTLSAASLSESAFRQPEQAVLFYATGDTAINAMIEELIHDSGFEPVHVGGIEQSIRIEVFGDLHEYGALGKTVTLKEVKQLLQPA